MAGSAAPKTRQSFQMQPRIYTYKVTFEEIPHWYWGVHKEKKFGEAYLGSPVTHRWMWDFYTPRVQVLEVFPYTDEGWLEANSVEDRLIRPDLNNPLCLNENCGGRFSLESCRKSEGKGVFERTERHISICRDTARNVGVENINLSRGFFSPDYQSSKRHKETGRKSGNQAVTNKTGIHSDDWKNSNESFEASRRGGYKTSNQVWESLEDGFRRSAGNVAQHNRANGWNPDARFRVK